MAKSNLPDFLHVIVSHRLRSQKIRHPSNELSLSQLTTRTLNQSKRTVSNKNTQSNTTLEGLILQFTGQTGYHTPRMHACLCDAITNNSPTEDLMSEARNTIQQLLQPSSWSKCLTLQLESILYCSLINQT